MVPITMGKAPPLVGRRGNGFWAVNIQVNLLYLCRMLWLRIRGKYGGRFQGQEALLCYFNFLKK
jgi:hypothetical protein